ncbi:hypothetical protein C0V77_22570 [Emticicia sp. TH156]|nr:hypothetical protein C0V77_22570 [Emticicia sp. TH156]
MRRISFGARTYNASIGRFDGVDELAEISESFSHFVYANNNPLRFVDPDGMASEDFTYSDGSGTLSARNTTGSVGFSGAYKTNGQEGCPPNCGGYGGGDPNTPYNAGSHLKSANQQNATIKQGKLDNFTPEEKAAHLGVDMASAVEGGAGLLKGCASLLKNGSNFIKSTKAAKLGSSTIYRAVSQAELDDIAKFGLRIKSGGYETGKLFAATLEEATQFGKYNFGLDRVPNTIIKVRVPNRVLNGATKFDADFMNAISIPADQLNFLKAKPLNYSPWLR